MKGSLSLNHATARLVGFNPYDQDVWSVSIGDAETVARVAGGGIKLDLELHKRYQLSQIPSKYSLNDIMVILQEKYKAREVEKHFFEDLKKDSHVNYDQIIICFKLDDKEILNELFSEEEKKMHEELAINNMKYSFKSDQDFMWKDIQEGKLIFIILESSNEIELTAFTIQGVCKKLYTDLLIYKGIDVEKCIPGNSIYERHLKLLFDAGYI